MSRTLLVSLVALAGLAVAGAALGSAQSRPSIHVQQSSVAPGGRVTVYGSVGSCESGDVTVISRAFPGHAFGEGALTGPVSAANHTFTIRGHVRSHLHARKYAITARCGGGNLGVKGHVRVS